MSDFGLPDFEAGAPLAMQLSASVMNALRDRISRNTPLAGDGISIRQTEAGTIIGINRQPRSVGAYDSPYTLGSRGYGSSTAGTASIGSSLNWGSATADAFTPWGGSADSAGSTTAQFNDEWHRDRPPLDSANKITSGGKVSLLTRILENPTGSYYFAEHRDCTFDSHGALVLIGKESSTSYDGNILKIRNYRHPWQCYITSNAPDNVKIKINEYSCLMKGQSGHDYFSQLQWNDRVNVANFSQEFTMSDPTNELWLVVYFGSDGKMSLDPNGNGPYMYQGSGLKNSPYETNPLPTYLLTDEIFKWQQLIAYWELTTGDMIADAVFSGNNYTLRCPTTTHLKESLERGYAAGNYEEIHDYPCIIPWHGCIYSSS